jgi:hypothetical protein
MANQITDLSLDQLRRAVSIKEQIARLESELNSIVGGRPAPSAAPSPTRRVAARKRGRGQLSPEARERIAEAQRQRWAKYKSGKAGQKAAAPRAKAGTRNRLSPEARAKIAEAARRRWARVRAGQGK